MSLRLFLPGDTTAVALGADRAASAITREAARRSLAVELVRNGSRGLFWLEPLLEVEYRGQRLAFGPICAADVPGLLDACAGDISSHPLYLGPTEDISYLRDQQRLSFARAGLGDPLSLGNYRESGGFAGLDRALGMSPQQIVDEVTNSGLRENCCQ